MRYLPAAILLSSLGMQVSADPVSVQSEWGSAFYSGSQRLALYTLLKERPSGSLKIVQTLINDLGLANKSGIQRLDTGISVSPVLQYDDNINGGTVNDSFLLGPFEFTVADDEQAKAGVIVGAEVGASADHAFGHRNLLETDLSVSYGYSPEHEIARKKLGGSACITSEIEPWTYSESCIRSSILDRDLGTSRVTTASTGLIGLFSSPIGSHEAATRLSYEFREDYEKPSIGFDITTARAGLGAVSVGAKFSPVIEGENTTIYSVNAGLSRPMLGRSGSISASFTHQEGSQFLGREREDDILSVSAQRKVTDFMSVSINASRRDSSVEFYDRENVGFRVNFQSWQPFE